MAVIVSMAFGSPAFADEFELAEELEFDPIHATIMPGSGRLKFEDQFIDKNNYIVSNGDALLIKASLLNVITTNGVELPIDAMQDYTIEFKFKTIKGNANTTISINDYGLFYGLKDNGIINGGTSQSIKWKMPKNSEKGVVTCKIVRHKNTVTFYLNDKYMTEITNKPQNKQLFMSILFTSQSKSSEIELQSIRLDQGAENDSED